MRLAESKIAALDLASHYDELGGMLRTKLDQEFKSFGLELTKFVIENISLPPEVEAAMDKRTSMGVIGDVGRYAQFQAADAMRDAAQNTGRRRGHRCGTRRGVCHWQCDGGSHDQRDESANTRCWDCRRVNNQVSEVRPGNQFVVEVLQ